MSTDYSIDKYIQSCVRNEREGQQSLYKHFYGFAMGICLRYANDRDDAAAILNDGFFKIFKHIDKYDPNKPFKAWLGRILTNTAIDHYRNNLKFSDHVSLDEHQDIAQADDVYSKLAYEDLLKMIQSLSPAYRTVFNLFAIDGFTHEEIAELLNISVGASKSNLFKARKRLQEMLKTPPTTVYERKMTPPSLPFIKVSYNTNME